jgi:Xaa-Pro aminopeptidase
VPDFDFSARMRSAQTLMAEEQVEVMLLSVGADLPYFTGYQAMPLERLTMLVMRLDAEPALVVPQLEAPRVEPGPFRVQSWGEVEDPLAMVADLCHGAGAIAIGDQTWSVFLLGLQGRLPGVAFRSATPITRALRSKKDPLEVEYLRRAGAGVDRVVARLADSQFSGHTEREMARLVTQMTLEEDHDQALFWIVASGPNSASPHHEPTDRLIQSEDVVVVDFGGKHRGYSSDCTRTFVVGAPNGEQSEVHQVVHAAQQAATAAVAPGIPAEDIDRVARRSIADAGYGEYFIHRTGHGIGLEGHEHPYLIEGNSEKLEPGMCFSIEPGVYLPGRFGVRIEDIVIVTEDGVESLNQGNRALVTVA